MSHLRKKVHWWPTGNPSRPWGVLFEGEDWEVAVIDVPGQPRRYSLLIGGREQEEFVDWPANWTKAPDNGGNASQRAEYERECDYFDKNEDVLPYETFNDKIIRWIYLGKAVIEYLIGFPCRIRSRKQKPKSR